MINIREIVIFIDDIIVDIKEKKGHDEVIEKVVRKLAENDLYIRLKKCKWKIREVGFLKVVIRLERIKIEKEKVKGVLD